VTDEPFQGHKDLAKRLSESCVPLPEELSAAEVATWVRGIRNLLIHRPKEVGLIEKALADSAERLRKLMDIACHHSGESECAKVAAFYDRLPEVERLIRLDVEAAVAGDPAAKSKEEVILSYPSVSAMIAHRVAHELFLLGIPLLPRLISEIAHSETGIDIHPGAKIGERMFIDHGTGVVIGETAVIGSGVKIYQGVTLGAKSFPVDEKGEIVRDAPRHPIVEDDVVVYAGATVLGRITIGKGSVIGGNVWLTRDVPRFSRVLQGTPKQEQFGGYGEGI
jgi:serine O-acetyltransferase